MDFPLLEAEKIVTAKVTEWRSPHDEDIAVLTLTSPKPNGTTPALLLTADDLWDHEFRAFGFPTGFDDGIYATGIIRGKTGKNLIQIEDIKVPGSRVKRGFSGTPVWDQTLKGVVGMVTEEDTETEVKIAFIIPNDILYEIWPELYRETQRAHEREIERTRSKVEQGYQDFLIFYMDLDEENLEKKELESIKKIKNDLEKCYSKLEGKIKAWELNEGQFALTRAEITELKVEFDENIRILKNLKQDLDISKIPDKIIEFILNKDVNELTEWLSDQYENWILKEQQKKRTDVTYMNIINISDFWKDANAGKITEGSMISIQGQLSLYAPLCIAPPSVKRMNHMLYRSHISSTSDITDDLKAKIDAMLSYTAGQMVLRLDDKDKPLIYLGLYHSIIRNSIPVFVEGKYYREKIKKMFDNNSNPYVMEAIIAGELKALPSCSLSKINSTNISLSMSSQKPVFAVMIDGVNSYIEYVGESRYLDGDIWFALEDEKKQFFVSRFIDFGDKDDLMEQKKDLRDDIMKDYKDVKKIIYQFDQVEKMYLEF
jgi:hypothetical protein